MTFDHIRFWLDLFEWELFRLKASRRLAPLAQEHLYGSTFVRLTNDWGSDSSDRCRCLPALGSRLKHCRDQRRFVASNGDFLRDQHRTDREAVRAHDCYRLWREAIAWRLVVLPANGQTESYQKRREKRKNNMVSRKSDMTSSPWLNSPLV